MDCKVIRREQYTEIWVSNNVGESELAAVVKRCHSYGLPVVVFRSGRGDLAELTGMLLQNNVGGKQGQRDRPR